MSIVAADLVRIQARFGVEAEEKEFLAARETPRVKLRSGLAAPDTTEYKMPPGGRSFPRKYCQELHGEPIAKRVDALGTMTWHSRSRDASASDGHVEAKINWMRGTVYVLETARSL